MRKRFPFQYFLIFFILLALMSLPKASTEYLRGSAIAFFSPFWQSLTGIKNFIGGSSNDSPSIPREEVEKVRLENALMKAEISHLREVMQQELRAMAKIAMVENTHEKKQLLSQFKKRDNHRWQKLLKLQLQAIPARVIYRSSSSWNSSFWIDVGIATNETLGTIAISKNSPVLIGTSVVGVIDYVGNRQSRVRLITDSGLTLSVRAKREFNHNSLINEKVYSLLQLLVKNKESLSPNCEGLINNLKEFGASLEMPESNSLLAKGELHGSSKPIWRTQRHQLHGTGFNYDFADGEGPARDLRTGKSLDNSQGISAVPVIKNGDLLVTTGMDGIFPPNLLVAEVSHIHMLKEGDYYYELEAMPTAGNLDDISTVFVIPPLGFEGSEQSQQFTKSNF